MKKNLNHWTKAELKVYLLLLCARTDTKETPEEIILIKSITEQAVFEKMYALFQQDTEVVALKKVETAINNHIYGEMEISSLRKEMLDVFSADENFSHKEKYLDRILDHIIY